MMQYLDNTMATRQSSFALEKLLPTSFFDFMNDEMDEESLQGLQVVQEEEDNEFWNIDDSEEQRMSISMSELGETSDSSFGSSSSSLQSMPMADEIALKCGNAGEHAIIQRFCQQNPGVVYDMTSGFVKNGRRTKEVVMLRLRNPKKDLEGLVRFFLQSPQEIFLGPMVTSWIFFSDEQQLETIINTRATVQSDNDNNKLGQVLEPKIEHLSGFRAC